MVDNFIMQIFDFKPPPLPFANLLNIYLAILSPELACEAKGQLLTKWQNFRLLGQINSL